MKYLCLVYGEESALQAMDDRHCVAFDEEVRRSGHCLASEALQPVATATTVRVRAADWPPLKDRRPPVQGTCLFVHPSRVASSRPAIFAARGAASPANPRRD